jgi:hypothetical protein
MAKIFKSNICNHSIKYCIRCVRISRKLNKLIYRFCLELLFRYAISLDLGKRVKWIVKRNRNLQMTHFKNVANISGLDLTRKYRGKWGIQTIKKQILVWISPRSFVLKLTYY